MTEKIERGRETTTIASEGGRATTSVASSLSALPHATQLGGGCVVLWARDESERGAGCPAERERIVRE